VRNSENTVVQFVYGDDSLNPDKMENNDLPVDFDRLRLHVCEISPCRDEEMLNFEKLRELVQKKLGEERFQKLLPTAKTFLDNVKGYFNKLSEEQRDLVRTARGEISLDDLSLRAWNSCRITETQLELILSKALEKCKLAYVEPGEAVGAVGAQSISEPGTQMTLKVGFGCTVERAFLPSHDQRL